MAEYRYMVADLVTDVDLADVLLAPGAQYGPMLNGGGTLTGEVPLQAGLTLRMLAPGRTAIYAYRDDQLTWGGIVWSLESTGTSLRLNAAGFESWTAQRMLQANMGPFTGYDRVRLCRDIWNFLQQYDWGFGVIIGNETSPSLVGTAAQPYQINAWEARLASEVIRELAEADDGFDYRIDITQADGHRTKTLKIGYPRLGARRTGGVITSGSNVRAVPSQLIDGTFLANYVLAVGTGTGQSVLLAAAARDRAGYPALDRAVAAKYETAIDRLAVRAQVELQARSDPNSVPSVYIGTGHPDLPFGSYQPGDEFWLDVYDGWAAYTGWVRIMGWTMQPDTEQVKLDLARADLFMYGPSPNIVR